MIVSISVFYNVKFDRGMIHIAVFLAITVKNFMLLKLNCLCFDFISNKFTTKKVL
jgi:hypothetical protein